MVKLTEVRKTIANCFTQPIAQLLARTPITPNTITWLGLLLAVAAAILIVTGELFAAGVMVLVSGFFDMLDGALARLTSQSTRFGAVLDSTLDRLAEALLLLGILVLYVRELSVAGSLLTGIVLVGSLMVSYVRARVEALGLECKIGLFTRPERVIVLALGLVLSQIDYALMIALAVIGLFSFFTVGQRLLDAWYGAKNS
ncbi:CDP-alcohol phosphatidyltransferase family protein [Chloroflexota bacterium]